MSHLEPAETLETFWRNVFLRGPMLFDPSGEISHDAYAGPPAGEPALPGSRGFVIGPDGTVALAHFGHDPDLFIETIDGLLHDMPLLGDVTRDGRVDELDLLAVLSAWGPCGSPCPADVDYDGIVSVTDLSIVVVHWFAP